MSELVEKQQVLMEEDEAMELVAIEEQSMLIEEDEANEATRELNELVTIKEQLDQDNTQYELHVKFIELLKKLEFKEQLETARRAMHEIYPLTEALWLDWIQDAKQEAAQSEDGEIRLLELYDNAQQDYFSIAIWKDYVEYKLEKFHEIFTEDVDELDETMEEFIETYRDDLLKAVRAATSHIKQSQEIWQLYAGFELTILDRFKTDEQIERVKKMYLTRLAVLHMDYQDTFNAYSSFTSNYNNANYEQSMVDANKIFAKTKVAAEDRDYHELQLVSTGYSLEAFQKYIHYEKHTKQMFSLNNVRALYERALLIYCTDPDLWNDYILFLIEKARVQAYLESTCKRSIRNCPWSGVLWSHLARIMEAAGSEDSHIEDIFDRALTSKALLSNIDGLVTVLLAKCDYKRRAVDWEILDEETILNLRLVFEESLEYLNAAAPETGDPYYRIEKYYAYILLKRLGNVDKAREIWMSVVDNHGYDTEAWIHYISFERDQGNFDKCTSLFKQAIQKNTNNPARLIDVWTSFEHEEGTLQSYEDALIKTNFKSKTLAYQWASLAADQKPPKDKKLMDRKKKSAHRLAQKQKAKGKKKEWSSSNDEPIRPRPKKAEAVAVIRQEEEGPLTPVEEEETIEEHVGQEEEAETSKENARPEEEAETSKENARPEEEAEISEEHVSQRPENAETGKEPEGQEETQKPVSDEDAFKKPLSPNKETSDSLLKRKLSDDPDNEKAEEKRQKTTRPLFIPRPSRGKKSLKLGQRAVSRNNTAAVAATAVDSSSTKETVAKSNDDFRAMLLGKK